MEEKKEKKSKGIKKTNKDIIVKKEESFKKKKKEKLNEKKDFHWKNNRDKLSKDISKKKDRYKKLVDNGGEKYMNVMRRIEGTNKQMKRREFNRNNNSRVNIFQKRRKLNKENTNVDTAMKHTSLKRECDEILQNENLSQSKKRKMIKEIKKKNVKENYDFDKKIKILLNKISQTKESDEKNKLSDETISLLKTCDVVKYARTNVGFHILNILNINASEKVENTLWNTFLENMKECCTNVYVSLTFQSFFKHGTKKMKMDIEKWMLEHPESMFNKFGSRLWDTIYKIAKKEFKKKAINALMIPNAEDLRKISPTIFNKDSVELFNELNDAYKEAIKKRVMECIDTSVNKELLYNVAIHQLISFACSISKEEELTELMNTIYEGCEYLITSEEGNKALMLLLGYSNNKKKKGFIKIVKANIADLCKNCINFLLIIRLLKITDDTKVLNQYIVKKIVEDIENLLNDKYGYFVIMSFFYGFDEKDKDVILSPLHKNFVYASAPQSVKDAAKRKNEILPPVINALSAIFKDQQKLNEYFKYKRYLSLIYEFLTNTEGVDVLRNVLTIFIQILPSFKDEGETIERRRIIKKKIKEKKLKEIYTTEQEAINQQVIHIYTLFHKLMSVEQMNILNISIEGTLLYKTLCECFLSNIKLILETRLISFFLRVLIYVKQNDEALFETVIKEAKKTDVNKIYEKLLKEKIFVKRVEEFMKLIK